MNRRKFLAMSSVAVVKEASGFLLPESKPRDPKRPVNVILMICDDIGFGDLGCYGSNLPTPNLDRMAQEGMRFTRFNGGHPLCSASRASLLTGRYGTRMGTTAAFGAHSKSGTSLDETIMAQLFKQKNYATKAV